MKSLLLILVFTTVTFSQWRMPFTPPMPLTSGGYVVDENTMWLCGSRQSIYKSTDAGQTWIKKHSLDNINYNLLDINFVNPTTGYASGTYGYILKTTDGGENWVSSRIPDTTYYVSCIRFFDENNGIVMSTPGKPGSTKFYRTSDGAATWTLTSTIAVSLLNMDFRNSTVGIAVEKTNNLYYTKDGGLTWNQAPMPALIGYSRTDQWGIEFVNDSTAYSCGWGSSASGYQPTIFMKTTDAGASWNVLEQKPENYVYVNFKSLYFKDENNGLAVGGASYPGTVICRTTDGGANWIPLPIVSGFSPGTIIGDKNTVLVTGGLGNILRSTDFGETWAMNNKYPAETMNTISLVNDNIYSAGSEGVLFKSSDNGKTFRGSYMVSGNVCLPSSAMQFVNENIGYSVGKRGIAIKTTNGGASWFEVIKDTLNNFIANNSLFFLNENTGFIVGQNGQNVDVIYKTTDGGSNWSTLTNQVSQELLGIAFANDYQGAACGYNSAMLYTTNQGETWKKSIIQNTYPIPIIDIKFYDGLNGIAVGNLVILKTTDGGANWTRISDDNFSYTLNSIYIKDQNTFYAAGDKCILMSTDAGNSWSNILDTVWSKAKFSSINGIAVDKNSFIWIAGSGGIATNAPIIDGVNDGNIKIAYFSLSQNYPNPFNPSTNISFNLKESGLVSLKIYDILGRLVKEISHGNMSAGEHTIQFNASALASGTYIYTMIVNNNIISRKMTLIK